MYRPFRGAITLIPVGRSGQLKVAGKGEIAKIYMPQQLLNDFADAECRGKANASELIARHGLNDPLVTQLSFALLGLMETQHADRLYRDCLMNALVAHLVRRYSAAADEPATSSREYLLSELRSRRAIDFMEAHLAESLGLGDVARELGLSTSHFSAQFRQKFGQSPARYLQWLRLERACILLKTTNQNVAEIANAVGFVSPSHFSQVFRATYGLGPAAYRAQSN